MVVLATSLAWAGEPQQPAEADTQGKTTEAAASAEAAELPKPVIPKRELAFDVSEEEYSVRLAGPDPKLLEQHYVAVFRLLVAQRPEEYRGPSASSFELSRGRLRSRTPFGEGNPGPMSAALLYESMFLSGGRSTGVHLQILRDLARKTPEAQRPPEEIVALLTTRSGPHITIRHAKVVSGESPESEPTLICEGEILAPTAERAKELTLGLLTLCDYGMSYPLQKECFREKQVFQQQVPELRGELKEAEDQLAGYKKEHESLDEFKDIGPESIADFITQLRLISVDLVGIRARIDACNKILAKGDAISAARLEQVETVKVTAEIEMVGLAAKRDMIQTLVEKGQRRSTLVAEMSKRMKSLGYLKARLRNAEQGITHFDVQLTRCRPFPVEDGKVKIRRIKWEPADYSRDQPPKK